MAEWTDIARVVAPTVATGLFGPAGGMVASVVAGFLFPDEPDKQAKATPASVAERIARITDPADMTRLREAELALRKFEADNEFRFADMAQRDMADARSRQAAAYAAGSNTADRLAWAVLASFTVVALLTLTVVVAMVTGGLRTAGVDAQTWVAVSGFVGAILGYFSANAQQVVSFYFGSSAGSKEKSELLQTQATNAISQLGQIQRQSPPPPAPMAPQPMTGPTGLAARVETPDGTVVETAAVGMQPAAAPASMPAAPMPAAPMPAVPAPATRPAGISASLSAGTPHPSPPAFASSAPAGARWQACADFVLLREGGEVNHPADRGGHTNRGITRDTLSAWLRRPATPEELSSLTEDAALEIYQAEYWKKAHCPELPAGVDLCVFDTAVLRGPGAAIRMLQQAAGLRGRDVDGDFGRATAAAVAACAPAALVSALCDAREAFHRQRVVDEPSQEVFLRGWLNRVAALRPKALAMAAGR